MESRNPIEGWTPKDQERLERGLKLTPDERLAWLERARRASLESQPATQVSNLAPEESN